MVVQIAGLAQFVGPGVETIDAGAPIDRLIIGLQQGRRLLHRPHAARHREAIVPPDLRIMLEPALPIGAPRDLMQKGPRLALQMRTEDGGKDLILSDQPVADIGR